MNCSLKANHITSLSVHDLFKNSWNEWIWYMKISVETTTHPRSEEKKNLRWNILRWFPEHLWKERAILSVDKWGYSSILCWITSQSCLYRSHLGLESFSWAIHLPVISLIRQYTLPWKVKAFSECYMIRRWLSNRDKPLLTKNLVTETRSIIWLWHHLCRPWEN